MWVTWRDSSSRTRYWHEYGTPFSSALALVCSVSCTHACSLGRVGSPPAARADTHLSVSWSWGEGGLVMGALLGTKLPTAELCKNMTTCIQVLCGRRSTSQDRSCSGKNEGCLTHPVAASASSWGLPGLSPAAQRISTAPLWGMEESGQEVILQCVVALRTSTCPQLSQSCAQEGWVGMLRGKQAVLPSFLSLGVTTNNLSSSRIPVSELSPDGVPKKAHLP